MNKVQKLTTRIKIEKKPEEIANLSDFIVTELKVWKGDEEVFCCSHPLEETIELAGILEKLVKGVRLETKTVPGYDYLKVAEKTFPILPSRGGSKIVVTSYGGDMDKHYEEVDKIVEELRKMGLPVESGECAVTIVRRC